MTPPATQPAREGEGLTSEQRIAFIERGIAKFEARAAEQRSGYARDANLRLAAKLRAMLPDPANNNSATGRKEEVK